MDDQPCRFVYDNKFGILIHDVQRNIFRLNRVIVLRTVEHQCYHVERTYTVVAFHRTVVHMHKTCVGSLLYTVTAGVLQFLEHELVDAQRLLSLVYYDTQMLIQLLPLLVLQIYVVDVLVSHNVTAYQLINVNAEAPIPDL